MLAATTQADAMCRGSAQLKLSDNSVACVVKKGTTSITRTRSIEGAGPAAVLKNDHKGAMVAVRFVNEKNFSSLKRNEISTRAKEICMQYRGEFLSEVKKFSNPFMVVVMGWGVKPVANTEGAEPNTYREVFLSKNCWIRS